MLLSTLKLPFPRGGEIAIPQYDFLNAFRLIVRV